MSIPGLKEGNSDVWEGCSHSSDGQAVNVRCGGRSKEGMHELSIRRQKEGYHNEREICLPILRVSIQFGRMS